MKSFFKKKDKSNYEKAKAGIECIKKKFDGFAISFPDVTPEEIRLINNTWEKLPKEISRGVKVMAINALDNYKSLIVSFKPYSYLIPHSHTDEYEYGIVLRGFVKDKFSGKEYHAGETYKFAPDEPHYLTTKCESTLVYSVLSENDDLTMEPLPKKIKEKLFLA